MLHTQAKTGSDGFNGDTMRFIPAAFYEASIAVGHPAAMQGGADPHSNLTPTLAHHPYADPTKLTSNTAR